MNANDHSSPGVIPIRHSRQVRDRDSTQHRVPSLNGVVRHGVRGANRTHGGSVDYPPDIGSSPRSARLDEGPKNILLTSWGPISRTSSRTAQ